ncbi:hypothetical protein IT774_07585 [Salinimonas marina]|uniref:Uncharacterized protein n=1 Tax=Salinimonas marina TaxID=2785918 RepID=A0A7S9DZT2_9ALTE|nr:hypothetical protein [Salinimonas marina]QPG06956.1 hypothetical protein IT774_07585 [Salinimonas marina]
MNKLDEIFTDLSVLVVLVVVAFMASVLLTIYSKVALNIAPDIGTAIELTLEEVSVVFQSLSNVVSSI